MPHFLVRGAAKADASDVVRIVHAADVASMRRALSGMGVYLSSFEVLDADATPGEDAGTARAVARFAGGLAGDGRFDEAVALIRQAYEMRASQGRANLCLRLPRYLLAAGRADEACEAMEAIREGRIPGNRLMPQNGPADVVGFFKMAAQAHRLAGRADAARLYGAAASIAGVIAELWAAAEGVPIGVTRRSGAVRQVASIAAEALATDSDLAPLAERLLGPDVAYGRDEAMARALAADRALFELSSPPLDEPDAAEGPAGSDAPDR